MSALYVMSDVFFSAGYFSPRNLFAWVFPLEITHNPLKSQMVAPKIHQIFGQLTDSDFSIIFKGFWNNGGQNSLGERGRIRFRLPLPGKSVRTYERTYGDVITKFSRMDGLPNFITHGAPLRDLILIIYIVLAILTETYRF